MKSANKLNGEHAIGGGGTEKMACAWSVVVSPFLEDICVFCTSSRLGSRPSRNMSGEPLTESVLSAGFRRKKEGVALIAFPALRRPQRRNVEEEQPILNLYGRCPLGESSVEPLLASLDRGSIADILSLAR